MKVKALVATGILLLLLGCSAGQEQTVEKGFLQGHITIGPLCPVERNPSDSNCEPTEQTYKEYALVAYNMPNLTSEDIYLSSIRYQILADKFGNYRIEVLAGSYFVMQENGLSKFSNHVEIKAGETAELNIDIDTGIR